MPAEFLQVPPAEISVPVPEAGTGRLACFFAGPPPTGVTLVRAEGDQG